MVVTPMVIEQDSRAERVPDIYSRLLAADVEIQAREVINVKRRLEEIIPAHSGQPLERVPKDMERDYFMTAGRGAPVRAHRPRDRAPPSFPERVGTPRSEFDDRVRCLLSDLVGEVPRPARGMVECWCARRSGGVGACCSAG